MALKVKAVERLLKFSNNENDPGVYRYVLKPDLSLCSSARTRHHAIRTPFEGSGEGGGREDRTHRDPSHHLHPECGPEGRAEEHHDPDHLYRPHR